MARRQTATAPQVDSTPVESVSDMPPGVFDVDVIASEEMASEETEREPGEDRDEEPARTLPTRRRQRTTHQVPEPVHEMSLVLQRDAVRLSQFFEFTPTGLVVKGRPNISVCADLFGFYRVMHSSLQFAVGDGIVWVEGMFGEEASQIIDAGDWSEETVRNYRWVASKVPMAVRRLPELTFTHHQSVANIDSPAEQKLWLDRAVEQGWSVAQLRKAMKQAALPAGEVESSSEFSVIVTCESADDVEACIRQLQNLGRGKLKKVIKEA